MEGEEERKGGERERREPLVAGGAAVLVRRFSAEASDRSGGAEVKGHEHGWVRRPGPPPGPGTPGPYSSLICVWILERPGLK